MHTLLYRNAGAGEKYLHHSKGHSVLCPNHPLQSLHFLQFQMLLENVCVEQPEQLSKKTRNSTAANKNFQFFSHLPAVRQHQITTTPLTPTQPNPLPQALRPWTKCLETWARKEISNAPGPGNQDDGNQGDDGPWTTITQPCVQLLSKTSSPVPTQSLSAGPSLAAHKALPVVLFRVMLLGDDIEGSPHRTPSPAAWAAARAYLLMLSLPGAAAYGVLQPAVMGMVLTNLRSWCRNSAVYRPGGDAPGKKGAPQKRRRGDAGGAAGSDGDSDGGGRGDGRRSGRGEREEVQACLELLKACLGCVSLAAHQVGFGCCGRLLSRWLEVLSYSVFD